MTMHITLVGINYFPEDSAIGLYNTQLCEYLTAHGCRVAVIAGFPYYPQWSIRDSYKTRPTFADDEQAGVIIYRYKQYVPARPSFARRIVHLLDFTGGSLRNLFKVKQCDLVIAVVPFTTCILLGLLLKKLHKAKLWVHVQDFEFDLAKDAGLANGKGMGCFLFGILMKVESWLLGQADVVSTISYSMLEKLKTKTVRPAYFFPNWVDAKQIDPQTAKPHPFLRSDKFKILYSGNIGTKQDWEFFIKVVESYRQNEHIEFVVVGDGARKHELVEKTAHLRNIHHYGLIDFSDLSNLLCNADLHILFQKGNVIDTVMPSKLLGMMASAKPSIVTGNLSSETAKLFEASQGGYFVDASDFSAVVKHIDALQADPVTAKQMGIAARRYIIEKFSKDKVLSSFMEQAQHVSVSGGLYGPNHN